MGARFIHQRSGFMVDLLEIQSVPQAFVWVTTFPTSNMGEPHTQEHLLLGKGNKGRAVGSHEPMSLAESSAFTMQWRTCYHFYTSAGPAVFYDEFERRMDALLHPDYTDEEVRREVRNFGVTENPGDHSLGLEEKGTVYNEMVSSMDQPGSRLYRAASAMIYGDAHPLAFNSGGAPEALRVIQPSDIRKFHGEHYHLSNMGAVISMPKEESVESILLRLDAALNRVEPSRSNQRVMTEKQLPVPRAARSGEVKFVEYPHANEQQPGSIWLVWPAERTLSITDETLLDLFLENFAGDPTTNLYKRFIDSRTREADFGAKSVFAFAESDQGHPVTVGFGDVPVARMNEHDIADWRARVLDEMARIAAFRDGSAELKEFNNRLRSRVIAMRRRLAKFVNSPPGFGFRGVGSDWMTHLYLLNKEPGFRKSVTMKPVLDGIERIVADNRNVWASYLSQWKMTGTQPWALAAKPNPGIIRTQEEERKTRVAAELKRLKEKYRSADDQETLRRYGADYDATTAVLEREARRVAPPRFIDNPPLTLDDPLQYKTTQLENGIPLVASTFESMTSGTTGIALRLDSVPADRLVYASMLPQLLAAVGVIENGKPVSYEEMSERLRKEILSLNANFSTSFKTGRVELVVRGSGNDEAESQRAVEWMQLVLYHPDWRPENLSRIRDLVDQTWTGLRRTSQTAEENWVNNVAASYWRQDDPVLLATRSFMTQAHFAFRLRWKLKAGTSAERQAAARALDELAGATGARNELKARLAAWSAGKDALIADAAKDLDLTLVDIPDSSLQADWTHLCHEMSADLMTPPEKTLAELDEVRRSLLKTGAARLFQVGSSSTQQKLMPSVKALVGQLNVGSPTSARRERTNLIWGRLNEREPGAGAPIFAGLLNPNSQSGVFLNSAPLASYEDTDKEKLFDYLSTNLYAGGGAHSIFMKTWSAGLAYSNGISTNLTTGRLGYYAERTPELPQTLRFVIGELQHAEPGGALSEYAVAQAFRGTRAASSYESRGEQMADNLADGLTPEIVTRFHKEILELRRTPDLTAELARRMPRVAATVLPGMGAKAEDVRGAVYFVIGPEKQFAAWEEYLKSVEGPGAKVYRLYPRDFWMY